jgi:hypothetical protein
MDPWTGKHKKEKAVKLIHCSFTSVWNGGSEVVTTPGTYNPDTGEVDAEESSDLIPEGTLDREFITLPPYERTPGHVPNPPSFHGGEIEVCTTCHAYVMKPVMNPGIGHDLNEEHICSDPDCESNQP